MNKLLTLIMILAPVISYSQTHDFRNVDNYAGSLTVEKGISIPDLTGKLTASFNSDLDKARAIFVWLATNIEYDSDEGGTASRTNYLSDREKVTLTYNTGKGTCYGYSHLFKYMLGLAGIRSNVIQGYVRSNPSDCFPKNPNHAWNSARVDDKWYLFDVTWARDTIKKVNDFWFQTDPEKFILNHYPVYQPYAFTEKQYSLQDFSNFPIYTSLFFDVNFSDDLSKNGRFTASGDSVTITLKPNFECEIVSRLYDISSGEWIPVQTETWGDNNLRLFIPKKGTFLLRIGALKKDGNSYLLYKSLVYYTIENR